MKLKRMHTKILIPIVLASFILVGILFYLIWYFQEIDKEEIIKSNTEAFEKEIDNNVQRLGNNGIYIASLMASMDTVISIYELYDKGADFDSISTCFKEPIDRAIESVERNLGVTPKIHFHLPPAKSFYRSWTDKRGDDLSNFRKGVIKVTETGEPLSGIETGREGFVVRGIVPVKSGNKVLGSVESYFSIKEGMTYSKSSEREEIAFFMDTKLLDIATDFAQTSNSKNQIAKIDNLVLSSKTSDNFNTSTLSAAELNNALKNKSILEKDNFVYILTPLKNYLGEVQGVGAVQIDISDIQIRMRSLIKSILIISFILVLIFLTVINSGIKRILIKRVNTVNNTLEDMSNGLVRNEIEQTSHDELGKMVNSLNKLIKRNYETATFARDIGDGNYNTEFQSLSENDLTGNALLELREKLIRVKNENEKRKQEDEQRSWAAQGIANFADILRKNNENMEEFGYDIINNLVKYVHGNQGGLFLINTDEEKNSKYIGLVACYAYNRRKYLKKRIEMKEGLVGRCVQEKESIYLTEIPEEYVSIESSLGEANPKYLLLVPLILNDNILGVIEIASFKELHNYQIEFIEKIGDSIASTVSTVQINIRTAQLLEQSNQQAEEMKSQEEEMRQNMEELQATQEESARREQELKQKLLKAEEHINKLTTATTN